MAGARPGGVTLIAVLTWINGAIGIINGILGVIGGGGSVAWITLVLGVIVLAVGVGLLNGSNTARILAAIVFVITVAASVYALITGGIQWGPIVQGALSLIALIMLFSGKANAFFRK